MSAFNGWTNVVYDGLTDDENLLIASARIAGYAEFFPSRTGNFDYNQGKATLDGAMDFLSAVALKREELVAGLEGTI